MMESISFGRNLKRLRFKLGITQEEMASRLNISQSTYCRMELRNEQPGYRQICEIAAVLGIQPEQVLIPHEEAHSETLYDTNKVDDVLPVQRRQHRYLKAIITIVIAVACSHSVYLLLSKWKK